ncbi:uncharacterized protein HfgLR_21910 (plasmid) [Haloferax gibbonsii]|uniref:Uncharacterized protein n=1 Tax=Haloferax gibbonsii TaxID=35746 RepID=A0A871BLH3_HALGI|nr:hypothetical protein [Haloferax gibbonsii]QOS13594.1 uncharacterized protein HfgLR_21910 [Haloferax gibbonsii]
MSEDKGFAQNVRISDDQLVFNEDHDIEGQIEAHIRYHFSRRLFVQSTEKVDDDLLITLGLSYPRDVSDCRDRDNVIKMVNIGNIETLHAYPVGQSHYQIDLPEPSELYNSYKEKHEELMTELDWTMASTIYEKIYNLSPVRNQLNSVIEIADFVRNDSPFSTETLDDWLTTDNTEKYVEVLSDLDFIRIDEDGMVLPGKKIESADIQRLDQEEYEKKVVGKIINDGYASLKNKLQLGMLSHFPKYANAYYVSAFRKNDPSLWLSVDDVVHNLRTEYYDNTPRPKVRRKLRSLDKAGVLRFEDHQVRARDEVYNTAMKGIPSFG